MQGHLLRQPATVRVPAQVFRDQRDAGDAFRCHLLCNCKNTDGAIHRLAACHGNGIVVEDLVGHVDRKGLVGRDRPPDSHEAGVKVGAVSKICKNMRQLAECGCAYPGRAFTTHLGCELVEFRVNRRGHDVAPDASQCQASLRYAGTGVVWAARAVVGGAGRRVYGALQNSVFRFQECQACLDQVAGSGLNVQALDARCNDARDLRHRKIRR